MPWLPLVATAITTKCSSIVAQTGVSGSESQPWGSEQKQESVSTTETMMGKVKP